MQGVDFKVLVSVHPLLCIHTSQRFELAKLIWEIGSLHTRLLYLLLCCVEQVLQGLRVDGAGVQLHEYAHHATQLHVLGSMHITDFLCSSLLLQFAY